MVLRQSCCDAQSPLAQGRRRRPAMPSRVDSPATTSHRRRMAIRYPEVLSKVTGPLQFEWSDKETLLYALAIGFGDDERDLPYVYEQPGLKVVPTLTTVLANGTLPDFDEIGINELMMVHGEQQITIHQPIPFAGKGTSSTRVVEVLD